MSPFKLILPVELDQEQETGEKTDSLVSCLQQCAGGLPAPRLGLVLGGPGDGVGGCLSGRGAGVARAGSCPGAGVRLCSAPAAERTYCLGANILPRKALLHLPCSTD